MNTYRSVMRRNVLTLALCAWLATPLPARAASVAEVDRAIDRA